MGAFLVSPFNVKWRCYEQAGGVEKSKFCLFWVVFPVICISSIPPRFYFRRHAFCFLLLAAILEFLPSIHSSIHPSIHLFTHPHLLYVLSNTVYSNLNVFHIFSKNIIEICDKQEFYCVEIICLGEYQHGNQHLTSIYLHVKHVLGGTTSCS
jgi:hypothetical protein